MMTPHPTPKIVSLSSSLVSQTFDIDNIPPKVEVLSQTSQKGTAVVRFKGTDPYSPLRRAEVSIDGKEWEIIFSIDGIVDSGIEEFEIKAEKARSWGAFHCFACL